MQIGLFLVAAVILLFDGSDALYWVAAGMIPVFIATVINAWVLLIEILR